MDNHSSPDYKALFLQAEALLRQTEEEREHEKQGRKQAEKEREQAEDRQRQAEEGKRQEKERNRHTTFGEFIRHCHNLLSRPLEVCTPSRSTTGSIPPPTGKYCPTRLCLWTDCPVRQQEIYKSVCGYLQPAGVGAPQLFASLIALEDHGRRFARRPISSEQDLESYERFAVEDHVHDIIDELCKLPNTREEFLLGDGVQFDNHANALDQVQVAGLATHRPISRPAKPDQFCIHRVDGNTSTLLTTVEYKPPHKLSVENLRVGLRPMKFWEKVVKPETIPTGEIEKYSYVTNGLALVLLRVPYDDPSTLYYYLCEPNMEIGAEDDFQQPKTAIARVLCLCLMSFRSPPRSQEWRNTAQAQLHMWTTSFAYTRSQIPEDELQQTPPGSAYTSSEYQPSSSPMESPTAGRRVPTRSQASCAPGVMDLLESTDSSDSDSDRAQRKRGFSQVTSSPTQRSTGQTHGRRRQGDQSRGHSNKYCTQRCLLGLQQGDHLDYHCPNVKQHQQGGTGSQHLINAEDLVQLLKQQLDKNIDHNCTPVGTCGASGAPFKLTCDAYGYTLIGKGTTSELWPVVSREAEIYHVLRQAQGSAVPVFLGTIDLAKIYFLHGVGEIRHMLVMGWGGEIIKHTGLRHEISRSVKEIRRLGVIHEDLRRDNILWNPELKRVLLIDFHRSKLNYRLMEAWRKSPQRRLCTGESILLIPGLFHWRMNLIEGSRNITEAIERFNSGMVLGHGEDETGTTGDTETSIPISQVDQYIEYDDSEVEDEIV